MTQLLTVLTEGYADWEPALVHGVGRGYYGLHAVVASLDGHSVRSQGGLCTLPDRSLAGLDVSTFDGLLLPGGTSWESSAALDVRDLVWGFLERGKPVGAICGATLGLARAGVLDGRRHTSNRLDFLTDNVPTYAGRNLYLDVPHAVIDRCLITAPGTAPVSFSVALLQELGVLDDSGAKNFLSMMAREHGAPSQPA
jgi:putative intracellular protease/amidase